jgi:hypothetical protein
MRGLQPGAGWGARKQSKRENTKMSEEMLIEMQFADVSEALRRLCFVYGNRYMELEDHEDTGAAELEDDSEHMLVYQLPNVGNAEPYDSARVSPSVMMAFAKDMMITPNILHQEEITQSIAETLDRRRKRAHIPASMDKTLCDFCVIISLKIMAKRPYSNVHGSATTSQKVRALVMFLSLDFEQLVNKAQDSRFSPINEIQSMQEAVETEALREKHQKRKYKSLDSARSSVSILWTHVHEIFLFFCETPSTHAPNLPQSEKPTDATPDKSMGEEEKGQKPSIEAEKANAQHGSQCSRSTVEFKIDVQEVNLNAIIQFHPSIQNSKNSNAARRIQRFWRRKYLGVLNESVATEASNSSSSSCVLNESVKESSFSNSAWHSENPLPPCGPAVVSLLPRIPELTNKYSLHPRPPTAAPSHEKKLDDDQETAWDMVEREEGEQSGDNISSVPSLMITRPVHEIVEWKRKIAEEDLFSSFESSGSGIGRVDIPVHSDRVAKRIPASRKSLKPTLMHMASNALRRPVYSPLRPKTSNGKVHHKGIGAFQPAHADEERMSSDGKIQKPGESCTSTGRTKSGKDRLRLVHSNPRCSKAHRGSIFSDDPAERKAVLDRMSCRETKMKTIKISPDVEALHEHVLEKWRQGTKIYDPFTDAFEKAARKIQRFGRSWLTRKIVREGRFLRDGMKAWLSARPMTEISSTSATIQLTEVLKVFKIFGVCPKVVSSSEILHASLLSMNTSQRDMVHHKNPRTNLTWSEFQNVCWQLSGKVSDSVSDDGELLDEMDGLIRIDALLRLILEGKAEVFDPERASEWIRARMLEYGGKVHKEHQQSHHTGQRGPTPVASVGRPESTAVHDMRGARSSKAGSVVTGIGGALASDGVNAYMSMCAHLDEEPVPTIMSQLHGPVLDLSHYKLCEAQIEALSAGLEKNSGVTKLLMVDAGLSEYSLSILLKGLKRNVSVRHLDLSENTCLDKKSVPDLSEYLAKNNVLQHLVLRGVRMSDVNFDYIVRNGIESNNKSLTSLDLTYNMLTDNSLENIEHVILTKANLQSLHFNWNLFSSRAAKQVQIAVNERSKPRSSKRIDSSSKVQKPLDRITLHLSADEQRIGLMHFAGASSVQKWRPEPRTLISKADYVTLCVALRSPNVTALFKFRLIRLLTSGRALTPEMVAEQLRLNFKDVDKEMQEMAMDMLLHTLEPPPMATSPEFYTLKRLVPEAFSSMLDEGIKRFEASLTKTQRGRSASQHEIDG